MPFWVAVTCLTGEEVNQVSLVIGLRIFEGYIVRPTWSRKTDLHPKSTRMTAISLLTLSMEEITGLTIPELFDPIDDRVTRDHSARFQRIGWASVLRDVLYRI